MTIKTLGKLGIEGNFLKLIKITYQKPTANIILMGEKYKAFLLVLGTRERGMLPFSTILLVLANIVRQEKEIKGIYCEEDKVILKNCIISMRRKNIMVSELTV